MTKITRRKSFLILPDLQYGLLGYIAAFAALMILAQFASLVLFLRHVSAAGAIDDGSSASLIFAAIFEQRWILMAYMSIPVLGVSVVGVYFFLRLSHRIAGPIYNISRAVENANADGGPLNIKLRRGDYFQDLAANLNKFGERVSKNRE